MTPNVVKAKVPSILASLKFSTSTRPTKAAEQQRNPRSVVLAFIDDQIGLASAELDGKDYAVERTRFIKSAAGPSTKATVRSVPRKAYWSTGSEWLGSLKYGNAIIALAEGHPSFVCGPKMEDVVRTFEMIKKAIERGECDPQIEAAATAVKAQRRKASA